MFVNGEGIEIGQLFSLKMTRKIDLQFQNPHLIVKSEQFEAFCFSSLLIWRRKMSPASGVSLVVRRV